MKRKKKLTLPSWLRSALHPSTLTVLKIKKEIFAPSRVLMAGFFLVILVGSLLLHLPAASTHGRLSYIDALFTATSAVCVTGLSVLDPGRDLTLLGQVILILLIQLGGLGFMTFGTMLLIVLRKRITLSERLLISNSLNEDGLQGIVRLVMRIMGLTLSIEGIGAVLLMTRLIPKHGVARGVWYSIFHAISAFCNAGIDLMGIRIPFSSLTLYAANPLVNLVIMALIIIGGIGFLTWEDIRSNHLHFSRYRMQSKVILTTTAILILLPALYFYFGEFRQGGFGTRILLSLFQSVTPRTAGFNTADFSKLTESGQILTIILMLIGGSPGSTAGGMKTPTVAVLTSTAVSVFRRNENPELFRRRIAPETVANAASILMMYLCLCLTGAFLISRIEELPMMACMFETASAVGTVGLSFGITPGLGSISRIILIILMYLGRVGGLTLIYAALSGHRIRFGKYPLEKITVG